jgi:hypothetical protein
MSPRAHRVAAEAHARACVPSRASGIVLQHAALGQRGVQKGAGYVPPGVGTLATDNDHVCRNTQAAQTAPQPDRLLELILHFGLNDQKVEIAMRPGDASGVRSEQHYLRLR